jgi:hypothetical protein
VKPVPGSERHQPCKYCGALVATDCGRIVCPQGQGRPALVFEKFPDRSPGQVKIKRQRFNNTGDSPLHLSFNRAADALALSPGERATALQHALENPGRALECYAAIARSL